ncbi:ribonuclease-3 [Prevotella aff. ruminicola Tc2-24]|uniref:Ribonuclease 3 n=1 Tax=Prevotella aff. ruminicola Tc2-24 TaxID=81582 RepID=A0A1I0NBY5_9BACT|nr:ribonuclease III [Prevotella aff. ruminicola Tc2-24]SEV98830.1 ribonuclease-3 [Prevotella aff. ruminicola Tc2-24]
MRLNNIIDRLKLPFRKEKELFSSLYAILGFYPHDIAYYKQALMHKSVHRRNAKGKPLNNERLEFLGDAILDAVVGDVVYQHYEGKREGFLTNTRSKLVSRETLGKLATEMGLGNLLLSAGHSTSHNSYVEGNALEALVGAVYLDRGYDACMWFWKNRVLGKYINIDKVAFKEVNFKSKLLEWSQKNRVRLEYKMLKQKKDDNGSPVFSFQVVLEGVEGEKGTGFSKKEAQQLASKETLQRLKREPQFVDAIFAAKTERTKMEEEPAVAVPDTEQEQNFIIEQPKEETPAATESTETAPKRVRKEKTPKTDAQTASAEDTDEKFFAERSDLVDYDLSDISHKEKSREDIIAEAEAAAFEEM